MKTTHITQFTFGEAKYLVMDYERNKAVLVVNYAENKFRILGEKVSTNTYKELEGIAKNLLRRKHKKNFAEKMPNKLEYDDTHE